MTDSELREGEVVAAVDPALAAGDARLIFIGTIRTPWPARADCPRNLREARQRAAGPARLEVDPPWRPALAGLAAGMPILVLYWMHEARRDLALQSPKHRDTPVGTFALRSPVRPNPIALAAVTITAIDAAAGVVAIDAIDCVDGTPLLDIKPYVASVDAPFAPAAPPDAPR